METFSVRQLAAIASANKTVYWIFRVQTIAGNIYNWSSGTVTSSGNETVNDGAIEAPGVYTDNEWERAETFKVINFSGIALRRSKSESGIHAPNDVSFTVVNSGNVLTASDFIGGTVRIGLVIEDDTSKELCGSWRFRIKSASPYSQQIDMVCEDFLQEFLQGSYPNTRLISDIFPNVLGTVSDNLCVPEPYGTCYIPLRSVYAVDGRYYLLGDTTNTYTITAVRSPREVGAKIEWTAAGGFAFTQSTKADAAANNWRVFQPIIADSNNDGTVDASGLWMNGSKILDIPTKFSRSDTASVTDPSEIIRRVLRNMGLLDTDLNLSSFATATTTFAAWGLAWNFAFWYKEDRPKVLARILAMCHCALIVGEQITLQVLSKSSQMTITNGEVLKMQEVGQDTFRYVNTLAERASDSGYVAFAKSGESQDEFIKALVPAKTTKLVIDSEVITFPGVSDTQQIQKLGTLYYQRKFLKSADVSATVKGTCLTLRPDDVITINYADYGGIYDVLIDEAMINPDVSMSLSCLKFSVVLDDWEDLAPGVITIVDEGSITTMYAPVIVGPDAVGVTVPPNLMPGRLRVGAGTSYILIDPATPLRISVYAADTEVMRFGNINGFLGYVSALYGIAVGDATNYLKYEATNGLRISGAIQGGTIDIGGSDASSFHIDTSGNLWLGAAAFNIATNPFAVSAAGAMRAESGVIGGFTLDPVEGLYTGSGATRLQFKPDVGMWAGGDDPDTAPVRMLRTGRFIAEDSQVTGEVRATSGYVRNSYLSQMTLGKTGVISGVLTLELADGLGDTYIASGKTDFTNVDSGFILGIDDSDSNTPKLYIGNSTKYLSWDGTTLTITGATLSSVIATGTVSDSFTVNSDLSDVNADLVLGRTTGGNATVRWNGSYVSIDKSVLALVGLHVGGSSDPGDNNLLVDGTGTITGAFGCNAAAAQTAYASGGALNVYATGAFGLDSSANMSALHALVVSIRAALVANGIMS